MMEALKNNYASDSGESDSNIESDSVHTRDAALADIDVGDDHTIRKYCVPQASDHDKERDIVDNTDHVNDLGSPLGDFISEESKASVLNVDGTVDKTEKSVIKPENKASVLNVDGTEESTSAGKPDFFGLSADDSDDSEEINNEAEVGEETQTTGLKTHEMVYMEGQAVKVEIPNTSFWSQLDTTELQTNQTLHDKSSDTSKRKILHKQGESHKGVSHKKVNLGYRDSRTSCSQFANQSANSEQLSQDGSTIKQKRKLFYVHNKIKPYLHSHSRNTTPSKLEWTLPAHGGAINRIKWNVPEFSHLFVTCSMDSSIKLWNIWSQLDPCLCVLRVHDKAVRDIDWNRTGRQLLSCSFDRTAKITDVETGVAVHSLAHRSFVTCGKYHPGQPYICVTGEKDKIQAWDLRTPGTACKTFGFKDSMGQVQDIVFSQDQETLFSCSDLISRDSSDRNMIAWDYTTGAPLSNQIYQERYTLTRMKIHPSENTLLAQSYGNYIALFSQERPYKMYKNKRLDGHKLLGYSLGFDISPDGSSVYSGSSDGTIHCYNYQSGKCLRTIPTSMDVVMDVAYHPVLSSTLAVCGWDGTVQVYK